MAHVKFVQNFVHGNVNRNGLLTNMFCILPEHLGKWKICAKWILHVYVADHHPSPMSAKGDCIFIVVPHLTKDDHYTVSVL